MAQVKFGSRAQKLGVEQGYKIVELKLPNPARPSQHWVFIPAAALAIAGVVAAGPARAAEYDVGCGMTGTGPRIALIHALAHSVAPINEAMARDWPQATRMNLLDDSLSADLAAGGGLDAFMHERFRRLAQYAVDCGSDAILFTCSAFGPCIERVAEIHARCPCSSPTRR